MSRRASDRDRYYQTELDFLLNRSGHGGVDAADDKMDAAHRLRDLVQAHRTNEVRRLLALAQDELARREGLQDNARPAMTGKESGHMGPLTAETGIKVTIGALLGVMIIIYGFADKYIQNSNAEAVRQSQMIAAIDMTNKSIERLSAAVKNLESETTVIRQEIAKFQSESERLAKTQARFEDEQRRLHEELIIKGKDRGR